MYKFLQKFLDEAQLNQIVEAYKVANPGQTQLPVYISQKRLNEVIAERDDYKGKFEAIPADWDKQLQKAKEQYDGEVTAHQKTKADYDKLSQDMAGVQKNAEIEGKLYAAKVRNVKAAKALIDATKPVDDEIKRLQKDEAYLFNDSNMPLGTGMGGGNGDPEPKGMSDSSMRAAVGLPIKENK